MKVSPTDVDELGEEGHSDLDQNEEAGSIDDNLADREDDMDDGTFLLA